LNKTDARPPGKQIVTVRGQDQDQMISRRGLQDGMGRPRRRQSHKSGIHRALLDLGQYFGRGGCPQIPLDVGTRRAVGRNQPQQGRADRGADEADRQRTGLAGALGLRGAERWVGSVVDIKTGLSRHHCAAVGVVRIAIDRMDMHGEIPAWLLRREFDEQLGTLNAEI
jgi:hypothetical protein